MRPKSKLGGNVELLTYSQLMLARGRNLDIITQAQVKDNFLSVRDNLELMSCGFYLSELVDTFTEESVEDKELFELFRDTLKELASAQDGDRILRYFELRLLSHLGYRPQLLKCSNCSKELKAEVNYYSPGHGGALCRECGYPDISAKTISVNALKVLRLWLRCDFTTACRVKMSPDLTREIKNLMRENIKYILEKQLKSIDWMDKLTIEGKFQRDKIDINLDQSAEML
jgi:DNA repair protein RecO (recombination protein O)